MDEQPKKQYSVQKAREKIRAFCAYRERSQYEVRERLYEYGLYTDAVNQEISALIQENFLNEERFARAFVRGKFSIKKWGRVKIKQALYPHQLSDYVLKKAFSEIEEDQYLKTLQEVIEKKASSVKIKSEFERNGKIAQYVISRGFEPSLVWEVIKGEL
ncbi:regulatory protein RecX [Owenweeksia hongkongensis]|uniref:regulatory protein RecX n=1 Tax=Owenweeksia hongkongensis TaxID=253245 RepID=UPI003A90A6C4